MQNESLEDNRNNGGPAEYRAHRARSRGANATFFALRLPPNRDLETAFVVNKVSMAKRRGTIRLNKTLGGRFEHDHPSCESVESKSNLDLVRLAGQRRTTPADIYPKDKVKSRYLGLRDNLTGKSTNRRAISSSVTQGKQTDASNPRNVRTAETNGLQSNLVVCFP